MQLTLVKRPEDGMYLCKTTPKQAWRPRSAGFDFYRRTGVWYTLDPVIAVRLREFAADDLKLELEGEQTRYEEFLALSRALDAERDYPCPAGQEYYPFQRAGIQYMLASKRCVLADEMGLGKTIQFIGVLNALQARLNVLVICPASLKLNWARELSRWLVDPSADVKIATAQHLPSLENLFAGNNVLIINYEALGKQLARLQAVNWDVIGVDEAHKMKNLRAKRTQLVHKLDAPYKFLMTGTPIINRPQELWSLLRYLAPQRYRIFRSFERRYCWLHDEQRLQELQRRLRGGGLLVRRETEEVLTQLPTIRRQLIEMPAAPEVLAAERQYEKEHAARVADTKAQVEELSKSARVEDVKQYRALIFQLRTWESGKGHWAKIRHETAIAKIPQVIEHVADTLTQIADAKGVLLLAHHRDVLEAFHERFSPHSVLIYGGLPHAEKQRRADLFQSDPFVRVCCLSIQLAEGLNLTKACIVVFAEEDWTSAAIAQSEKRAHRIGQTDSVLVQHLLLAESIDARFMRTQAFKAEIIEQAIEKDTAGSSRS